MKYTELLNKTLKIYKQKGSKEAYEFIEKNKNNIIGYRNEAQIYNFRYALAASSGLKAEALKLIKEAIVDKGYWYSYDYLKSDEDLECFKDNEDFINMINLCKEREQSARNESKPIMRIIDNKNEESKFVMALHGNQENIQMIKEQWEVVTELGYKLAMIQSSQVQVTDGYVWSDINKGFKELLAHYECLQKDKYDNLVVGGFSAGAGVIVEVIINQKIKADKIILVAPWFPNLDKIKENIYIIKAIKTKIYMIIGDEDDDCLECTREFKAMLDDNNIEHDFEFIKGLDHSYPDDFNKYLNRIL
ncbi:hypothetical protein PV797_05255 [Clostridiaceae bacterium M8S5]|nr:hypothetical protein PV797_05255 [Clostridiaceae bacterium M8S5]